MSFSDNGNMFMPVAPAYNNGGFGGWNDDIWLILIILFAFGGFGGMGGGFGGMYEFPWLWNGQNTNAGFNQAATQSALGNIQNAITSGFGDVQLGIAGVNQNLCQTGNGIVNAINNGFNSAEIAANSRQMANMQQGFNLSQQLSQCCCDNRLATAQTQALVQSENCADRAALSEGIRDIITNQTANTQAILDKLCQQEIDTLKTANSNLQTQVLMRDLAASQTAQTAQIVADNTAQTQYLVNRIAPYPQPAIVYGYNNSWMNGNGCGCGIAA